jgi:hypothetical protein
MASTHTPLAMNLLTATCHISFDASTTLSSPFWHSLIMLGIKIYIYLLKAKIDLQISKESTV